MADGLLGPEGTEDFVQWWRTVLVAALDGYLARETLRSHGNLVPFGDLAEAQLPVVGYFLVSCEETGGTGDTRRPQIQFTALAATEAQANRLLGLIERHAHAGTFATVPAPVGPVDACVAPDDRPVRRGLPFDKVTKQYRADLDMTFEATRYFA